MSALASESMSGNANVAPSWRLSKSLLLLLLRPRFFFCFFSNDIAVGLYRIRFSFLSRFRLPVLHCSAAHTQTFFYFSFKSGFTYKKTFRFSLSLSLSLDRLIPRSFVNIFCLV